MPPAASWGADVLGTALEAGISFCLVAGGFFALVGSIGLVRLPDYLMRLHAPTKATTIGVGGVLVASLLYFTGSGRFVVHELLMVLFLFVTAPVSALMLARAGIRLRLRSRARLPETQDRT
jgi:multicomponent K+:H+ antiporter subunit G